MDEIIRVGIVDSDDDIRVGRKIVLQSSPRVLVSLEVASSAEILERFTGYLLDVLVIDQRLKGMSGIDVIRRLSSLKVENAIATRLLLTAPFASERLEFDALTAGATAFVAQEQGAQALIEAVHSLATRRRQYSLRALERLAQRLGDAQTSDPALDAFLASLAESQRRIIEAVVSGTSIREVSEAENEPAYRIRKQVESALARFGLSTLEQLQIRFIRSGRLGSA